MVGAEGLKTRAKIYALHAPQVDCISKGKARKRYVLCTEVSMATTIDEGFGVGLRSMPGNPCDGNTLPEAMEQVGILTGQTSALAVVHGVTRTQVLISDTRRSQTPALKLMLRRGRAIELEIGHMEPDGRLSRFPLEGATGDAIFCGCAHSLRKIVAHLRPLLAFLIAIVATVIAAAIPDICRKNDQNGRLQVHSA
ncbi:hypothetical protein FEV53_19065 [Palleronia caenipelagi]|uniref:Transposase DDE domain-containing protein n=1 Tax=Palleronia caenipelagi TaxID=2489174 RepID=A0A547PJP9_9RHOB|nr:hypothetical protein FEV53_19065 [Palleronia caenipelagi]